MWDIHQELKEHSFPMLEPKPLLSFLLMIHTVMPSSPFIIQTTTTFGLFDAGVMIVPLGTSSKMWTKALELVQVQMLVRMFLELFQVRWFTLPIIGLEVLL